MSQAERSQRAYARFAGLMYLVVLAVHLAGLVLVTVIAGNGTFDVTARRIISSEGLYRVALVCSLIGSLLTVLLATGLYAALKPVDRNLAMMALLFRTGESVVGASGIATSFAILHLNLAARDATPFGTGPFDTDQLGALASTFSASASTEIAAIFFSLGSTIFFYVLLRSKYIPKVISAWGIFASLCYALLWLARLIVPQSPALVVYLGSLPILIAELSTGFWLLTKGIDLQSVRQRHASGFPSPQ